MLNTAFYFVLNMSINASIIIIFILLIRRIKLIPKSLIYIFWSVAFMRLLLPFSISSRYSLFNYTGGLIKRVISLDTIITSFEKVPIDFSMTNFIGVANDYLPITYKSSELKSFFIISSNIWIIGVIVAFIILSAIYFFTKLELKKATHIKDNIYILEKLSSPTLVGIFKPKIIFPAIFDLNSEGFDYIVAHENAHKKRFDNIFRVVGLIIVLIHWFNPLAWLMLKYFLIDMELSCDEKVVKEFDVEKRKEYANTLVNFAESKQIFIASSFGKSNVRQRVLNVLNYKSLTLLGIVFAVIFLFLIAIVFLTNP